MAKRKITSQARKLLTNISNAFKIKEKKKKTKLIHNYFKATKEETNELIKKTFTPSNLNRKNTLDLSSIMGTLSNTRDDIIRKKLDYSEIIKLAPEIEQAALLVIPSILSPNALKNTDLFYNIKIDNAILAPKLKDSVMKLINSHVNDDLKLSTKIGGWIKEALYRSGAQPLMIIPPAMVNNIRNQSISFEDIQSDNFFAKIADRKTVFGFGENLDINIITKEILADNSISLEGITASSTTKTKSNKFISNALEALHKKVIKDKIIDFTDNPETLLSTKKITQLSDDNIFEKYKEYFSDVNKNLKFSEDSYLDMIEVSDNKDDKKYHPTLTTIPCESVHPITIDGEPDNHIGYLISLNENGHPVSLDDYADDEIKGGEISSTIDQVYTSMFGKSETQRKNDRLNTFNKLYEIYLDKVIQGNLKSIGIDNLSSSFDSSLNKVMFYRLLKHKKTKLLFVPKFLMTYLAFNYNTNGTGRSKLENIIFALSLKVTFLVLNILRLEKESSYYEDVKVSLEDTISNPLEILEAIKSKLINGRSSTLSYDPTKIMQSLSEREVRVIADKIPGIENFSIERSQESKGGGKSPVDDKLIEEINRMINLELDVPPAVLNNIGENEFSRSILTNNIFYSKKIELRQKVVISHMSNLLTNYLMFDGVLLDKIRIILKKNIKINQNVESLLYMIIRNVELQLPSLRIAFEKSEMQEINEYIDIVDKLVENIFPKDLVNRDDEDVITNIMAVTKANMLKQFLIESGSVPYADELLDIVDNFNIKDLTDVNTFIQNVKKATESLKSKIVSGSDSSSGY